MDHVLEEVLRPKFSSKILLDEVFVGPVQVKLLCGDHDPAVAGGPQLVAAEKSNLEEENLFSNIFFYLFPNSAIMSATDGASRILFYHLMPRHYQREMR